MSLNMNNSMNSASAAARAAKADFTAPVAPNRGQDERAANNAAQNRQPAYRAAPSPSAPASASASAQQARLAANQGPVRGGTQGAAITGKGVPAGKSVQSDEHSDEAVSETPAAAPFAQLINLADLTVAGKTGGQTAGDGADGADGASAGDEAGKANAAEALPAMLTSMLNTGAASTAAFAADSAARADTVSAVSTLNASATRLNLSAVSVAVNAAPTPAATDAAATAAAARAAAQLQATPGVTAQGVYVQASGAAQGAIAQQANNEAPTASAGGDAEAAPAVAPAPVNASGDTPAASTAAALPRSAPRGAETGFANQRADVGAATVANANSGAAKDEGRAANVTPAVGTAPNGAALGGSVPAAPSTAGATVKLAGTPEQWQQPLREALGDRLQLNLQRNNDHAVIRLEPPNMGSIEISIRHSAGSLQVSLSANNSEVLRQLNTIGDSVRQDLSTRSFSDVAVTVSASRGQGQAQSQPDGGGRNGQQRDQDDGRTPGRALSEDGAAARFAMTSEQE
jgi:flagellar hook-length control protein FliK